MKTYIYTLSDPKTKEIRYVGKSINPYDRFRKHINEANQYKKRTHKNNWIRSLLSIDEKPELDIIDETDGKWEWLEIYWICQLKAWGFNLVNSTGGGDNPPSWRNRTHSEEYKNIRRKIMLSDNPSKNMNDIWRKNISNAHKNNGFLPTEAAKANKIKVMQFTLNNEYVRTWDSITDAANGVGLLHSSGICAVCNNRRKKAGGYKWSFIK